MATTPNSVITPQGPLLAPLSLAAVTACATRAPVAAASLATNNIFQLVAPQTNGCRIDRISVKGSSSSISAATVAQSVIIWLFDGTTAWAFDEILVTAVTPSTTVASFQGYNLYQGLVLPPTWSVYASTTITTTAATTALDVIAQGAVL